MKTENKTPIAEEIIRNNPTGHGLFAGIGDNFNSVAQVICELMDDAVSNLRANSGDPELSMRVVLSLENLGDAVEITVTDGGTGIADLGSALTIACRDGTQTPLNEHGFGLKHALASCDSSPDQKWSIRTRTKADAAADRYREVTAPYSMGTSEEDKPMKVRFYSGTGDLPHPTGTSISVRCPMAKFRTVKPDRKAAPSDFRNLVRYIIEELRYVYAGILANTPITMEVWEISGGEDHEVVVQILNHFVVAAFSYTDNMFVGKNQRTTCLCFFYFNEFACRSFTQRTFLRSCVSFIYVTADSTSKFFHFTSDFN